MKQAILKTDNIATIRHKSVKYKRVGNLVILPDISKMKNNTRDNLNEDNKNIKVSTIYNFINGLQKNMMKEIDSPEIDETLINEETNILEHQIILLDIIKNYLETF